MQGIGPVVILCGGRGTRLQEHTRAIPKALVEIGGRPILWHVIRIFEAQGFNRFLLLTGYRGDLIDEFVETERWREGTEIDCLDTGLDTPTGGRIALASKRLTGETFCATYADGVANVDLHALLDFHRSHGDLATMTVVRPYSQWGVALLDGDGRVTGFQEKPRVDYWINGGFFCFEPKVLAYLDEGTVLEEEPLQVMAVGNDLHAYRHDGFWDCMDTYKDAVVLNDLWESGKAPWRIWERDEAPA
jgi:glucose-1-phosphate cytidylyltransferase